MPPKEIRENNYWLRIINASVDFRGAELEELKYLINESSELKLILGSIVVKSKSNHLAKDN